MAGTPVPRFGMERGEQGSDRLGAVVRRDKKRLSRVELRG